jgi:hypothetical protein
LVVTHAGQERKSRFTLPVVTRAGKERKSSFTLPVVTHAGQERKSSFTLPVVTHAGQERKSSSVPTQWQWSAVDHSLSSFSTSGKVVLICTALLPYAFITQSITRQAMCV